MCGIAGVMGFAQSDDERRRVIERMIRTLHHRGPDGYGFHVAPGIGLAHARLSIIDLATGDQPIRNEDGSVWVIFNGEIFNYIELRATLEGQGHRFYTSSDTEVIVHLYEQYGEDFVTHLNGQFAIALWDSRERRLVLARDRVGIRPLYYTREKGQVWFASEAKALLAVLPELGRLSQRGLAEALTFWAPVDPDSIFEGIQSLPPGYLLSIDGDGRERLRRYWDWTYEEQPSLQGVPERECAEQLRELLIDAVRLQLRADVPVGAYLSGGLDSCGIVAMIRNFSSAPLRTFSVAFEDAEFDESEHQQALVRYLRTDHTTVRCRRSDIGDIFPRLILHTETPLVRTGPAPLMLLSARVREEGYKVVLTGEGADEVFGGYDLFKEAKVRRFWARQPDSRFRPKLLSRLYPYLRNSPVANPAFAKSFFGQGMEYLNRPIFAHVPRWATTRRAWNFLNQDVRAELEKWDPYSWYEAQLPADIMRWPPLARDQYVEAKTLLAGYLLSSQGDRVAAANSIEGRVPYLDHRVIEFANRLPSRLKIRGLREKHLLRSALENLLPAELVNRTKQPYRAPDSQSFFEDGRPLEYVADLMSGDRLRAAGYFDATAVGRLFEKCRSGRALGFADNQAFVGILSTMLIDEAFVRRRLPASPPATAHVGSA
jgi:asparagine synthase (glutamine-hydrolysing)